MSITNTKYFGEMDYDDGSVIHFPLGILGFPPDQRYLLIEKQALRPLYFLQSLEVTGLCFLTMPAMQVNPDFVLSIDEDNRRLLGLASQDAPFEGLLTLAIVNFDEHDMAPAANIFAPLVIHVATRRAAQVIQYESGYQLRHPVRVLDEVQLCW